MTSAVTKDHTTTMAPKQENGKVETTLTILAILTIATLVTTTLLFLTGNIKISSTFYSEFSLGLSSVALFTSSLLAMRSEKNKTAWLTATIATAMFTILFATSTAGLLEPSASGVLLFFGGIGTLGFGGLLTLINYGREKCEK